ncbi:hypothetical protein FB00_13465 [Cellulosimicrobium funkei]|uniref:Uncharacterized protein n=1 Tax=Cellulosimicrobium funkei TaxID=264251 RepID=A0A0H2L1V0_9MICO|nr:hypothetical protein [Cellulosimicrobium funkei]KLN34182.1 hypothetical protein FB00_13465 [Cellulosimicrobium funkei]
MFARGQLSLWSSLPRDQLGSILDDHDLVQTLTANLSTVGARHVLPGERFGLAAGLSGALTVLSRGKATGISRTSASLFLSPRPVRAILDESVTAAAFNLGAVEVAQHLATMVIKDFEASS